MYDLSKYDGNPSEHIAIIGMNGRFPGADNINQFWENLKNGVESIQFFTRKELEEDGVSPELLNNHQYIGAEGMIEGMGLFDAEFFGISPAEAELLDPQHRLFLECAWELMELSGYDAILYDGKIGVYASANLSSYLTRVIMSHTGIRKNATSFQLLLSNDKDFVATRVSYKLNLKGPSMSVSTLCSSSLVAVYEACQALQTYQCDMAMAGAISLQASRNELYFYQEGGIGSSDGHCRSFDENATGTVSGNGVGIVMLKRLEDAVRDGDTIHAVIRGLAVNNDGAGKPSFTAPGIDGQTSVIAEALAMADVDPETISYVEAQGTGTKIGDSIEIQALTNAFTARGASKKKYCAVGTVKPNIGHLVNAGGVAGLIKTVLAMENKMIPPSINFQTPNKDIDFENSPFYVNTNLSKWDTGNVPLRAGVSSFGIGGTNVHVVLEEAPTALSSGKSRAQQLVILSARSEEALHKQAEKLIEFMAHNKNTTFSDMAYTLKVGRRTFDHRLMLTAENSAEALQKLKDFCENKEVMANNFGYSSGKRKIAFCFGNDEHLLDFFDVYDVEPQIMSVLRDLSKFIYHETKENILDYLEDEKRRISIANNQQGNRLKQLLLFSIQYALYDFYLNSGINPNMLVGYGVGELVVASVTQIIKLETTIKLLTGSSQSPVSLEIDKSRLEKLSIKVLSFGFGGIVKDTANFEPVLRNYEDYSAASFKSALAELSAMSDYNHITFGWDSKVAELSDCGLHGDYPGLHVEYGLNGGKINYYANMLELIGRLWLRGSFIDWNCLYKGEKRKRICLPTYPFKKKLYWIKPTNHHIDMGKKVELDNDAQDGDVGFLNTEAVINYAGQEKLLEHRTLYERPNLKTEYVAPRNALEKELIEIWKTAMGFETIGVDDNFFELGGDSWVALKTMEALEKKMNKKIPAANLFKNPTIRGLAEILSKESQEAHEENAKRNKLEDRRAQMASRNSMLMRGKR